MLFLRSLTLLALAFTIGAPTHESSRAERFSIAAPIPPPAVPREFRAAWVTPMPDRGFRDWPSKPGLSADSQKTELRGLLDRAAALGLNAIVLHVRMAATRSIRPRTRRGPRCSPARPAATRATTRSPSP